MRRDGRWRQLRGCRATPSAKAICTPTETIRVLRRGTNNCCGTLDLTRTFSDPSKPGYLTVNQCTISVVSMFITHEVVLLQKCQLNGAFSWVISLDTRHSQRRSSTRSG